MRKRVEVVTLDAMKEAGEELNLRLRAQGLDWDKLIVEVFPSIDAGTNVTHLTKILMRYEEGKGGGGGSRITDRMLTSLRKTFGVRDSRIAEKIARYCIERT